MLPLLEKLCAAIGAMATRLDRLENAYFDAARGPADSGVVGSASFETSTSLVPSRPLKMLVSLIIPRAAV